MPRDILFLVPFHAIVGHRRSIQLLSRAVARGSLPPSLLFEGPHGIGKRTAAVALAEAINCLEPRTGEPLERDACGTCVSCRKIARGVHPDVLTVEPGESGNIKIEQVRAVIDSAGYRPFEAHRRVVIVDEADAMAEAAQSALLKTLEEPPSASYFVLVTSIPDALLPTILSRCSRVRFGALAPGDVAEALVAQHGYSDADARAVAAEADGSIGRALLTESADAVAAREDARRLLEQASRIADPARRLDLARELTPKRKTPAEERGQLAFCLQALRSLLRDVALLGTKGDTSLIVNADLTDALGRLTAVYDVARTMRAFRAVDTAIGALERNNASPKIVADWLVLQL